MCDMHCIEEGCGDATKWEITGSGKVLAITCAKCLQKVMGRLCEGRLSISLKPINR